jgi:hypothetical protein
MANEATLSVNVVWSDVPQIKRLVSASVAHVERAVEKHGMLSPDDCYEPTMAELWRAVLAIGELLGVNG